MLSNAKIDRYQFVSFFWNEVSWDSVVVEIYIDILASKNLIRVAQFLYFFDDVHDLPTEVHNRKSRLTLFSSKPSGRLKKKLSGVLQLQEYAGGA